MQKIEVSNARSLVGSEIALTDWFVVDQSKIDTSAAVTGDHLIPLTTCLRHQLAFATRPHSFGG